MSPLLFAALLVPLISSAQRTQLLTPTGSTWSYQSNKVDPAYVPPDAWTAPGFNDSAWPTGVGLFGLETPGTYPYPLNTRIDSPSIGGAGVGPLSSYFRARFTWTGSTAGALLRFTNYIDDGLLVFLNGQELFSFNVPETRPLPWNTLVLPGGANPGGEPVIFITNIVGSPLLVEGVNVIAVALHQQANTTSDNVFGMALVGVTPFAPTNAAVNQPTNRVLLQSRTTTLLAVADGYPDLTYEWFENGVPISGATGSSLVLSNASPGTSSSNYFCRVSNPLGSFDTRVATVVFTADQEPPIALRATQAGVFESVSIDFNEALDPTTAQDPFGYEVRDSGGNPLGVNSATLANAGTTVILALANPMTENTDYFVSIDFASDIALNGIVPTNVAFRSWVSTVACGGVLFEVFNGTPGPTTDGTLGRVGTTATVTNTVDVLTNHATFPTRPSELFRIARFDSREAYPDDSHEHYGGRMRGVFIPPASGDWVFYLRSDDPSELYLNPTGPGANGKQLIAFQRGCCNNFMAYNGSQTPFTSTPVPLTAGQGYYIEALYKEGTGGDYCQVAARLATDPVPTTPGGGTCADCIPASQLGSVTAPANVAGTFTITQSPANQSTVPNTPVTFSVGTSTTAPLCYQWLRDGADIPGAIGPYLSFTATAADNNARFSVRVSVLAGPTLTSGEATLTVAPDTTRPTVVSAAADLLVANVIVTFSEPVDPASAQNPANYAINGQAPTSATVSGATVTLVPSAALQGCVRNTLRVSGVTDLALNPVNPNPTDLTFSAPLVLVRLNAAWRYEDSGTDLGTAWSATGFNDSAWLLGPGVLGFEPGAPQVPPIATPLSSTVTNKTAYFRVHFNLPTSPQAVTSLQLVEVVDDGAVYHLNGVELNRTRMPAGTITAATLATGGGPEPVDGTHTVEGPTTLPTAALVYGDNVLAVELHPSSLTSSDAVFGAQLNATVVRCVPPLFIERVGSQVRITWPDPAYRLERAPTPTGGWVSQAGASGVLITITPGQNAFFRLAAP